MIAKNGLILSSTKYRDYDAIINVLFEDGYESILIRGAYRPKSTNLIFTNILIYANLEYYQGKVQGNKLKTGEVIENFNKLDGSFEHIVTLSFIDEVLRKIIIDSDYDKLVKLSLSVLRGLNKNKNIYQLLAYFLLKITKILGVELNLDSCAICGKKGHLNCLSFMDGGLICDDHTNEMYDLMILNDEELCTLKSIYEDNDFSDFSGLSIDFVKCLTIKLTEFLEDSFSVRINSLDLLTKHS